ncbi:5-methylcytosine-specific restriction enzyme subunit McrC [Paraliobacillus sp. PM-2]|uniref:McrC family protein n=1 Tax=Paraliobacillus sp. PM-2 TaxID=1462524 RepID=UPI00061BE440|nr:restriction endonuclease [Paraliobacillus sp. PM-2]CQR46602.1 5-methylcytosine-specific restriction enzyme subunit McrC [Paraliobacillus sp. PM-2]
MREWQSEIFPDIELETKHEKELARLLSDKEIVKIIELKDGLSISTNSFVGSVYLGDIHLNIMPKIKGMDLLTLMNYVYQLKDLTIMQHAGFNLRSFTFMDILIYQLYVHTEDLFIKGFHRGYIRKEEELASPKGRLDFNKIAENHYLKKATLPSRYYERNEDNLLNQVLLAGIKLCISLASDPNLIVHLRRLYSYFEEYISNIVLTKQVIKKAKNNINRLTERYRPLLEIISILQENQGIELEGNNQELKLQGFFFDMNHFFESLVGRLLQDYVPNYAVREQFLLHDMFTYASNHNPKNRRSSTPRPDFAIEKNGKVIKLLDAKYKDLWENALPRDMLYQLSVYALSSEGNKKATIIYPSLNDVAVTQEININNPTSDEYMGSVVLNPLNLSYLSSCLADKTDNRRLIEEHISGIL